MAGLGRRSHYRKHLTDSVLHDLPEPDSSAGERIAIIVGTRGGNMFDIIVAQDIEKESEAAPPSVAVVKGDDDRHNDGSETDTQKAPTVGDSKPTTSQNVADNTKQNDDLKKEKSNHDSTNELSPLERKPQLALLPTKFRKLIWVKRGDFVIVECGDDDDNDVQGGVRYLIKNVLYKKQVAHLRDISLWPCHDELFQDEEDRATKSEVEDVKDVALRIVRERKEAEKENGTIDEVEDGSYTEEYGEYLDEDDDLMLTINPNRLVGMRIQDSDTDSTSSEED